MTQFYFKGDALFARDVDVSRLARELRKHLKKLGPADAQSVADPEPFNLAQDQGLELVSRWLGASSYYEARKVAADPSVVGMTLSERDELVQRNATSRGRPFAKRLPARFGPAWQQRATTLFAQAAAARTPGAGEFVALVGGPDSGKTILAEHLAHTRGGHVIDVSLTWRSGMDGQIGLGQVLIHDAPARSLPQGPSGPDWASRLQAARTLSEVREILRRRPSALAAASSSHHALDWVRKHPGVVYVHSFASDAAVTESIAGQIALTGGDIRRSAPLNWRRVHVVNLDSMTTYAIDGPGIAMEEGRRPDGT